MDWKKANKFIPKDLRETFRTEMFNVFYKEVQKFEKKYDLSILKYLEEIDDFEKAVNPDKRSKEYLYEKLQTKKHVPVYKPLTYKNIDEAIEYCKNIFNYLDNKDKENKMVYYTLGETLFRISKVYDTKQEFMNDMEEKLKRKKTVIYQYLSFYNLCQRLINFDFINTDLSFREIMKNTKELKEMYKECQ